MKKQVRFAEKLVAVKIMYVWPFAYRTARNGDSWMQLARDRDRFNRRIRLIETIIAPILENHIRVISKKK